MENKGAAMRLLEDFIVTLIRSVFVVAIPTVGGILANYFLGVPPIFVIILVVLCILLCVLSLIALNKYYARVRRYDGVLNMIKRNNKLIENANTEPHLAQT